MQHGHHAAGQRLLETYTALALRGEHLLHTVLGDDAPRTWQHYPHDDAIDETSGYQWFYHSHSSDDRPGSPEHGHFHLFARRPLWSRRLQSRAEKDFLALTGRPRQSVNTRHLLALSLDARGIPSTMFTVNSWVTGDLMLSAPTTAELLAAMHLDTGHVHIDTVLRCVVALHGDEIGQLLEARDAAIRKQGTLSVLEDRKLEILSETPIHLDQKLAKLDLT